MTDRLQKLLRQRALLQEHLAWLDQEIAGAQEIPPPLPAHSIPTSALPSVPASTTQQSDEAEKIIGRLRDQTGDLGTDTRRGCLLMFSIGMALFLLAVGLVYYFYARHLGRLW